MKLVTKKTEIIVLLVLLTVLAILIGPMDVFRHGCYYEEYDYSQIADGDWKEQISLEYDDYEMEFSPSKDYLNGFSIYLNNQPEDNEGTLTLSVIDENGKIIDITDIDLGKPIAGTWYKTTISSDLKSDRVYKLIFSAKGCKCFPCLQNVSDDYLPDETISGSILISYAYAEPTFTYPEKVMIELVILAIGLLLIGLLLNHKNRIMENFAIIILLTVLLSWNYMYNSMDNANTMYDNFQMDSEALVTNMISAEQDGEWFRNELDFGYGLGGYTSLNGKYISDDKWIEGYSRTDTSLLIASNAFTKEVAVTGNLVLFSNGDEMSISRIEDDGSYIRIFLDSENLLIPLKLGSLSEICFLDNNGNELNRGILEAYRSQYGLQGKVFRHLARYMDGDLIDKLHLICCMITAMIFALIVLMIAIMYNKAMAGCFFITFWLSPWIICFARNLYWVEFTWFFPMLVGLFCLWKINEKKYRIISYLATFVSVCAKSLCGYEYISVVMMGLIAFLLVDAVMALGSKDKDKFKLLMKTTLILGSVALAGFIAAIILHAKLKGHGDIVEGIKQIIEKDVLRRTSSSNLSIFDEVYWPSLNASVWETYCKYFKFRTEIITGVTGNLFPLLCVVPLYIFWTDYKNNKLNLWLPSMYIVFFLTSISWFCLAKGHSYIHTSMNYVLWYFGYVQTCFYVIIDKLINVYKKFGLRKNE